MGAMGAMGVVCTHVARRRGGAAQARRQDGLVSATHQCHALHSLIHPYRGLGAEEPVEMAPQHVQRRLNAQHTHQHRLSVMVRLRTWQSYAAHHNSHQLEQTDAGAAQLLALGQALHRCELHTVTSP